jgi:hypothetical protein
MLVLRELKVSVVPQTEFMKEKLQNLNDFKPFMRIGFNTLMTKELQTQCSYTGKMGYGVSHLNCFVLLQGELEDTCKNHGLIDSFQQSVEPATTSRKR